MGAADTPPATHGGSDRGKDQRARKAYIAAAATAITPAPIRTNRVPLVDAFGASADFVDTGVDAAAIADLNDPLPMAAVYSPL